MLGTKKTATAGIRNSNLSEMAYEKWRKLRCLPSAICVVTGTDRHRKKKFLPEHIALNMEEARGWLTRMCALTRGEPVIATLDEAFVN